MKILTTIITSVALFISITTSKAQHRSELPAQDATGISLDDIMKTKARFKYEIERTKTRSLPITIDTNFDSFIDEADYNEVDIEALQLNDIVHHNFQKDIHNYKAIASYKIGFSEDFYSIVVTVIKKETKMESILINYTLDGKFMDSILVSHDDLTESSTRTITNISESTLTRNHIFIEDQQERIEESVYRIGTDGILKELSSEEVLVDKVIRQLELRYDKVNTHLLVTKVNPANTQETIMVIPEYAEIDEDEIYFELNSHIVVVTNLTGDIIHHYFESSKTNGMVSDAVRLSEITIDTAPYIVAKNARAFGVRVNFYGLSKANPYSKETISLFVKSGNTLKKVLHNFDVMEYGGEWDTNCAGAFIGTKKILILSKQVTKGYYDIIVKEKITETINYENEEGDCDTKEKITSNSGRLLFDGKTYISN